MQSSNDKPLGKFTQKQVDKINKRRLTETVADLTPAQEAEENEVSRNKDENRNDNIYSNYCTLIKQAKEFCKKTAFVQTFYAGDVEKALSQACGFSHTAIVPKAVANGTIQISYATGLIPEPCVQQLESIFVRNVNMAITEFLGDELIFPKELFEVLVDDYSAPWERVQAIEKLEQKTKYPYLKPQKLWQSNDNYINLRSTHDLTTNEDFTLINNSKYIGDKELLAINCVQGVAVSTNKVWRLYSYENFNKFCYAMHCTIEDELKITFGTSNIEKIKQELLWLNELYVLLPTNFNETVFLMETNLVDAMKISYDMQSNIDNEHMDHCTINMKEEDKKYDNILKNTLEKGNFYAE